MNIKTIFQNKFFSVKLFDEWFYFIHEERCKGEMVAIILYQMEHGRVTRFLGRYENTLQHLDGISLKSVTGGVENGDSIEEAALKEVHEETGYLIELDDLEPLGFVYPSKQMDTKCYLFGVNVGNKEFTVEKPKGDDTGGEVNDYVRWVGVDNLKFTNDPLLFTMIHKLEL